MPVEATSTIKSLNNMFNGFDEAIEKALDEIGKVGVAAAKDSKYWKDRSGGLRKSIKFIPDGSKALTLEMDTPYAGYVEYGNRPGGLGKYIYPKRARALRFEIDGKVIFARRVRAHGPLPTIKLGADAIVHQASDLIVNQIDQLINRSIT